MKKYAVLTSGGDSPGMNCAIRAVTRSAIFHGAEIYGIFNGYSGLIEDDIKKLETSNVGNILQTGGTILRTSRCPEFHQPETRAKAAAILKKRGIDGLIVIGGDGSYNGAYALHQEHKISVVGIPGTIDNDITGTNYTIGFDTAAQTGIEAVDKIRDTALSHGRVFLIEVMGRNSSALALHVAVCTGAENVIAPNMEVPLDEIASSIQRGVKRGKKSSIFIVAEGKTSGRSYEIQKSLLSNHQIDAKVCILGHIQRGGAPSGTDRLIATQMGDMAIQTLLAKSGAYAVIMQDGKIQTTNLVNCLLKASGHNAELEKLIKKLSI